MQRQDVPPAAARSTEEWLLGLGPSTWMFAQRNVIVPGGGRMGHVLEEPASVAAPDLP